MANKLRCKLGMNELFEAGTRTGLDGEFMSKIIEIAQTATLYEWYEKKLPGHFQATAPAKYPDVYSPRTKKYMLSKAKRMHHQRPMVWSGRMEREFLSGTPTAEGKHTRNHARVELKFPFVRVANFWQGNSSRGPINFHAELTAFNPEDLAWFIERVQERAQAMFYEAINAAGNRIVMKTVA